MKLTPRQEEVLNELPDEGWWRPMDIGGRDGSDHSAVLASLVKKGLAERKHRGGAVHISRASYVYRRKRTTEA